MKKIVLAAVLIAGTCSLALAQGGGAGGAGGTGSGGSVTNQRSGSVGAEKRGDEMKPGMRRMKHKKHKMKKHRSM